MAEELLEGLVLRCRPLGEHDRLLTLLSEERGQLRLAVPGARRPKSSLAAALPLTLVRLQAGGRGDLKRVRQLEVLHSHAVLGERLDTLAAAQGMVELAAMLVPEAEPVTGLLPDLRLQLSRLEAVVRHRQEGTEALATAVQACVHLLALGGYGLPLQSCARSGRALEAPLGDWSWRCSLLSDEGLAIGAIAGARMVLNASELTLLQRLPRAAVPRRRNGELLGPEAVWLRLLGLVEIWCGEHLGRRPKALGLLRSALSGPVAGKKTGSCQHESSKPFAP